LDSKSSIETTRRRRLISRDPVPGINRFAYAEGDPINFTDPSGMCLSKQALGDLKALLDRLESHLGNDKIADIIRAAWEKSYASAVNLLCGAEKTVADAVGQAADAAKKGWEAIPPEAKQCALWGLGAAAGGGGVTGAILGCIAGAAAKHFDPAGTSPETQCLAWAIGGLGERGAGAAIGCAAGLGGFLAQKFAPNNPAPQCVVWGIAGVATGIAGRAPNLRKPGAAGCVTGGLSGYM
jgi:hypothetical protein